MYISAMTGCFTVILASLLCSVWLLIWTAVLWLSSASNSIILHINVIIESLQQKFKHKQALLIMLL